MMKLSGARRTIHAQAFASRPQRIHFIGWNPGYNRQPMAGTAGRAKRNWILVIVGMAFYVGAFFLIAAQDVHPSQGSRGYPGYFCALITLMNPWGHDALDSLQRGPIEYFGTLFSGWINPLFLLALVVTLLRPKGRLAFALRIALLLMFAACWVVFYKLSLYPREGYFVWMAGMLLVIFAAPGARPAREAVAIGNAVDHQVSIS
jgi:hypothetical protein